jgi:hypothetical protein
MKIIDQAIELKGVFTDPLADDEDIDYVLQNFLAIVPTSSPSEVEEAMLVLSDLFSIPSIERASFAAKICGYLVEQGYSPKTINKPITNLLKNLIQKATPFYNALQEKLAQNQMKEDSDWVDVLEELSKDFQTIDNEAVMAWEAIDEFYPAIVSVYSADIDELNLAKSICPQVKNYAEYSNGYNWLNKLFDAWHNESILVINLENYTGWIAKAYGIVDYQQLQTILMGDSILNPASALSQEDLKTAMGEGPQQREASVSGKWNMYNWEVLQTENVFANDFQDTKYWIWMEGELSEISLFEGYRVILLNQAPYVRVWRSQRVFNNLKAQIIIEKILDNHNIEEWLNKMARTTKK